MSEDSYSFSTARTRLEEIVSQVRKKDTSLEKSLDLLEEGVRLANQCTELIDHVDWDIAAGRSPEAEEGAEDEGVEADDASEPLPDAVDGDASAEDEPGGPESDPEPAADE